MKLNSTAFEFAKELLKSGKFINPPSWMPPPASLENQYIEKNGMQAYSKWYLGIREEDNLNTKSAHAFEFTNDFQHINLSSLRAVDSRAGQNHYNDILEAGETLRKIATELGYM